MAVPERKKIEEIAQQKNIEGDYEELCKNQTVRIAFLEAMNALGKTKGLKSFEQAKNIYLEPKSFQER